MSNNKERDRRMVGYIKDKLTAEEIGRREGIQRDYASRLRKGVATEEGLTLSRGKQTTLPHGLDAQSFVFRHRLGNLLYKLWNEGDLTKPQLANLVGVPSKLQRLAHSKPFSYNWSINEIQLLAKALNRTFSDVMEQVTKEGNDVTH